MARVFDLRLGLPHTNRRGLSEPLLLMHAGHFQWTAVAEATGGPLSRLRTASGGEVYAAFYYIEERIPDSAPLQSFQLDDVLRFGIALRSFKNIAVEGRVVFDRLESLKEAGAVDAALARPDGEIDHPFIRFGNIFITPVKGNSMLRVAPPIGADFSGLAPLPNEENPYHLTRAAAADGDLGLFGEEWRPVGAPYEHRYVIDEDRDTNGAGLVYFAQYLAFMETAERLALANSSSVVDPAEAAGRSLRHRRIAYYGNADISDAITTRVTILRDDTARRWIGFSYLIRREQDGQTICRSQALKSV